MTTVMFPLSAGRMMMLSSFFRFEMAPLRPLLIFWSGSLATCNALLTSFLSLLSYSHINCLHVASVAAMMALYGTRRDTMANLSPRDRTSCSFRERGLLLRIFNTFDVSVLGGCCLILDSQTCASVFPWLERLCSMPFRAPFFNRN